MADNDYNGDWCEVIRRFEIWKGLDKIWFLNLNMSLRDWWFVEPGVSGWLLALEGIRSQYRCSLYYGVSLRSLCILSSLGKTCLALILGSHFRPWSRSQGADPSYAETVPWWRCDLSDLSGCRILTFWMQLLQCPVVETRDIKKMRLSHRIVTSGDTPKGCFPENDPSKKLRWQWKVHHFLLKGVDFFLNYHVSFQECNIIRYIH